MEEFSRSIEKTARLVLVMIRAVAPKFRNAHDKVAFVIHTTFMASGFDLHATGSSAFTDDALYSSSTDLVSVKNWDELDDYYGFVYSNSEKDSRKILVKCVVLNDNLLVDVLRKGDSEPAEFQINVKDYVTDEVEPIFYHTMFKDLQKLVEYVVKEIISKYNASPSLSHKESGGGLREESGILDPMFYSPVLGFIVPAVPYIGGSDLYSGYGAGVYPTWFPSYIPLLLMQYVPQGYHRRTF